MAKIAAVIDEDAMEYLVAVNQRIIDLAATDSPLSLAQLGEQRALLKDFVEYTRQTLGLPTTPTRGA